jgi:hypothetical protein
MHVCTLSPLHSIPPVHGSLFISGVQRHARDSYNTLSPGSAFFMERISLVSVSSYQRVVTSRHQFRGKLVRLHGAFASTFGRPQKCSMRAYRGTALQRSLTEAWRQDGATIVPESAQHRLRVRRS